MKNSKKLTGLLGLIALVLFTMSFSHNNQKNSEKVEYAYIPLEINSGYAMEGGKCGTDAKAKKETKKAEKKCGEGKMNKAKKADKKCGEGKCGEAKCGKDKKGDKKCGEGKCGKDKKEAKKEKAKCGAGKCGK